MKIEPKAVVCNTLLCFFDFIASDVMNVFFQVPWMFEMELKDKQITNFWITYHEKVTPIIRDREIEKV